LASQTKSKEIVAKATKKNEINQQTTTVLFGEKGIVEWQKEGNESLFSFIFLLHMTSYASGILNVRQVA